MKPTAQRRRDRRTLLDHLLTRALRGRLTVTEAALLTEQVREEQRVYDQTRRSLGETTAALGRHREAADEAIREMEQRALDAEEQLRMYRTVYGEGSAAVVDQLRDALARVDHCERFAEAAGTRAWDAEERAAKLGRRGDHWKAKAQEIEQDRDRIAAKLHDAEQTEAVDGYGYPVHWTVYNDMHQRALKAETDRDDAQRRHAAEANRAKAAETALTRIRDAASLHRKGLIGRELYAVIEAHTDDGTEPARP
ncbi:hypothetical protein [Streptomyces sp. NPDC001270]|uniref:hypothetical protein n=1 Tax=Streptomyces sp. NPDC001270 TaxID=3364554 RepID=UPI0036B24547